MPSNSTLNNTNNTSEEACGTSWHTPKRGSAVREDDAGVGSAATSLCGTPDSAPGASESQLRSKLRRSNELLQKANAEWRKLAQHVSQRVRGRPP